MEIVLENTPAGARMTLTGELTVYAAAEAKERLLAPIAEAAVTEIELSRVSEIDSAGLQLLILAKRHARRAGKELRLTGHSRPVLDLIELFNLAPFFGDPVVIPHQESPKGARCQEGDRQ
ncbi:MAG: STAS domain-containing protein [Pseudomonadota bacterium]